LARRRLTFDGVFPKVRTLLTTRDPSSEQLELVELVRELCRRAARPVDDVEIRSALQLASARDQTALRKLARAAKPPAAPLGPLAWLDVARGIDPSVASARELGGYYALLAERDALAAMLQAREPAGGARAASASNERPPSAETALPASAVEPLPARLPRSAPAAATPRLPKSRAAPHADAAAATPAASRRRRELTEPEPVAAPPLPRAQQDARAQHLLGLFAYHRDAPLVARALGLGMTELERELDALKLRRKAFRLVRGFDSDLPAATPIKGARSGPPVRRRSKPAPAAAAPANNGPASLKAALKAVGPRRNALAARLEVPVPELLSRLRDAGLERDFADAERDLLRDLYVHNRGSGAGVAKELGVSAGDLRALLAERSLPREIEGLRERYRRQARQDIKWPRDRIEQVLRERPYLEDLGVWEELHREVSVRAKLLWKDVRRKPDGLELLQKTLRITPADARELRRLLDLR
jgi:hypothetical protein